MALPVWGKSVQATVEEDCVSGCSIDRSDSEGRPTPSGLADNHTLPALSFFFDDESESHSSYDSEVDVDFPCMDMGFDPEGTVGCIAKNNGYVIDHSIISELCTSRCDHWLGGCQVQLNRCAFYRELYLSDEVDPMADYLFHGVCHGFDIVDPGFSSNYFCSNYHSIEMDEFRVQMDKLVKDELDGFKISRVSTVPSCVHALGAVKKSNGKLRPITDCRRPLGISVNNFMTTTYAPFHYITLDDVCEQLEGGEYLAVVDIKSAYRSVNVSVNHRQAQGFSWGNEGHKCLFTDNCLCLGLRCAPFMFTQFTEFIGRCMARRGFHRIFGYIDDFLLICCTYDECV